MTNQSTNQPKRIHMNVCRGLVCIDWKVGRAQTPSPGEWKGGPLFSSKAGSTARWSCLHRDCHRNVLIKVNSKSLHCANSIYRILCVVCSAHTWVCEWAHRGQNRTSGVFLYHFLPECLKKGSPLYWKLIFARLAVKQATSVFGASMLGFTGPAQLFTWVFRIWIQDPCLQNKCLYPLNHFLSSYAIFLRWQNDRIGRTEWYSQDQERRQGSERSLKLEILTSYSR